MGALAEWESLRCPCGCGQQISDTLTDSALPPDQRPEWVAAYIECDAGRALEQAMDYQAKRDQELTEKLGRHVPTRHRLWRITRKNGDL